MYQRLVRCFLRLSENSEANETLKKYIPKSFIKGNQLLKDDKQLSKWHKQLMDNLNLKSKP